MGYRKIPNLYADQRVLMFRECYALEKVHGTSAHVGYRAASGGAGPELRFFAGGAKHHDFVALFDQGDLAARFSSIGHDDVTVYGEAYGGKMQGMRRTYGDELRFIAFEVRVGDSWLSVPNAADVADRLGLEFVPYNRVPCDVESLDRERDRPSRVAVRRGCGDDRPAEGIVIRPLEEFRTNNGDRVMAKHKRADFCETRSKRETQVSPEKAEAMRSARGIAEEWVTPMRIAHVVDAILATRPNQDRLGMDATPEVIRGVIADVEAEAGDQVEWSKDARKAVGARAAHLFKEKVRAI